MNFLVFVPIVNKMKKIILFLIVAFTLFILLNKLPTSPLDSQKIHIATSLYPLYFFASQIAGDKAIIKNITPAGVEPHEYEPTPRDLVFIEKSQLLILNGGVETWGKKVTARNVLTAGAGLINGSDPHVWLDPLLAKQEAKKIAEALVSIDKKNKNYYKKNAQKLYTQLDSLDVQYRIGLSGCKKHDIVTSHAAFGYLANAYGLHQVAITGLSPDAEPSTKKLAEVTDFVKTNKVTYIFFETLVSPKLAETIAAETGAKTLVLDPLEGISEGTFITIMQSNLDNLQKALECTK